MRVSIVTIGSEGDIRPYIALALELQGNGYDVSFATLPYYSELVGNFGIKFIPLKEYQPPSRWLISLRFISAARSSPEVNPGFLEDLWNVCKEAEMLIYNPSTYPCYYIALKLGVPSFGAFVQPHHPTRSFPHPFVTGGKPWGGIFNKIEFWLFSTSHWLYVRKSINKWRKETLGSHKLSYRDTIPRQMKRLKPNILYAYSPALLPRPSDWQTDRLEVTGYWFLDTNVSYCPSQHLESFLDCQPAPVFISIMWNIGRFTRKALDEIASLSKYRIVIHDLHGEMGGMTTTEKVFYIEGSIPHEWLFKKVSIAVHHGGLGISMNCIRAKVPMITIPAPGVNDHRFWAYHISRSGIGKNLPNASGSGRSFAQKLIAAIDQLIDNEAVRARVSLLSEKIADETGLRNAIDFISKRVK